LLGRFILISNSRYKLEAAKYHLQRMRDTQSSLNYYHFRYELDAFLSAARSVTSLPAPWGKESKWYIEQEFSHRPGFRKWYDDRVDEFKTDTTWPFLKQERNIVVHFNQKSVHTRADATYSFVEHLPISSTSTATVTNTVDGTTQISGSSENMTQPEAKPTEASIERIWYFDTNEITGDKKVIPVCEWLIGTLERLIDEVERL
jgi:hypothetical protein